MFEGLKNKLGRFKDDVEEQAEEVENVEDSDEIDEERIATEESTETTASTDADTAGPSTEVEVEAEAATESEPGVDTDSESESGSESDARSPTAESEQEPEQKQEEREVEVGFGTRAKAFATGGVIIQPEHLDEPLENLELALLSSDVEMGVAQEILAGIRENLEGTVRAQVQSPGMVVEKALREALLDVISVGQFDFDERIAEAEKPLVIMFTGVNGVGKTTTIAKLARYFEERGNSTVLANGDTYRAGANQQLREHAEALDKRLISHEQGGDPTAVIYDAVEYAEANDVDIVLGDTAGRLHTNNDLMAQLEKIDRVVEPDMTLFVDEAVAGQDAVRRASEFDDAAEVDGAILTKADADPQGGAAISIAHVTGKPILFLGVGQGYDDIEPFDPEVIVDHLLGAEE
jgi:fused signal recognition particle receptor